MKERADILDKIGCVLSYSTTGNDKVGGQTVGANGAGSFCVLFIGSPDKAEEAAYDYLQKLKRFGYKEISAIITTNDPHRSYFGSPLITEKVKP